MNPYTPSSSRLFFGREEVVRQLLDDEQSGQSDVLIGGRRCGKTRVLVNVETVLKALAGQEIDADLSDEFLDEQRQRHTLPIHWPIIVNFMGVDFDDYGAALAYIARTVLDGLKMLDSSDAPPVADEINDAESLEQWLIQIVDWLSDRGFGGIALLVDEVGQIFRYDWHHQLMHFLRRLDDSTFRNRIWMLLVGADTVDRYQSPLDGSPPLNTTRRVRLPDLNYAARRRMAIELFSIAGRLPPDDETVRELDRLAGGNVWLLTLLLEPLFRADQPTREVLDDSAADFLEKHADLSWFSLESNVLRLAMPVNASVLASTSSCALTRASRFSADFHHRLINS